MTVSRKMFFEAAATGDLKTVKKYVSSALENFAADYAKDYDAHEKKTIPLYERKLHITNEDGETALHLAAKYGHQDIVNYLLAEDFRIHEGRGCHSPYVLMHNLKDANGNTPLITAASHGYEAIVTTLLTFQANCSLYSTTMLRSLYAEFGITQADYIYASLQNKNPFDAKQEALLFGYGRDEPLFYKNMGLPSTLTEARAQKNQTYAAIQNKKHRNAVEEALLHEFPHIADLIETHAKKQLALREKKSFTFQDRIEAMHYKGALPPQFLCSITGRLINDCIILSTSQICDRASLAKLFLEQGNPPMITIKGLNISIDALQYATFAPMQSLIETFVKQQEEYALDKLFKQIPQDPKVQNEEKLPSSLTPQPTQDSSTLEDLEKARQILNNLINDAVSAKQQKKKPTNDAVRLFPAPIQDVATSSSSIEPESKKAKITS